MKYQPLQAYLSALPAKTKTLSLSLDEVEKILNARLPKSAYTYQEWWANQDYGSQAPSWKGAGFLVDSIDLRRKIVRFRREAVTQRRRSSTRTQSRAHVSPQSQEPTPTSAEFLLKHGFERVGVWSLRDGTITLKGSIPTSPAVYAHVVDEEVKYIGSATVDLKKRMYFYANPGPSQTTNQRINPLIREQLEAGSAVELLAAHPGTMDWNDLPVDLVPGLEAGLLKKLSPPWNK